MKTIYWNVDTQRDFMLNNSTHHGTLYIPGAESIIPNLEKLTKDAEQKNIIVVNTADYHRTDSKEISLHPDFKTTFPPHCMAGLPGASYIDETLVTDGLTVYYDDHYVRDNMMKHFRNIIILKDDFDVFKGNPHTDTVLELLKPDRVVVYGVATNVCVDYAVMGLLLRGIDVCVPTDAIKELPNLPLEEVLQKWKDARVHLTTTDEVINW
ncbi:MAG: isochorismatase family protein [Nanoarchaeota archaeon]